MPKGGLSPLDPPTSASRQINRCAGEECSYADCRVASSHASRPAIGMWIRRLDRSVLTGSSPVGPAISEAVSLETKPNRNGLRQQTNGLLL